MNLIERIRHYIEQHKLLAPGDTVLIGVSGGPDSLALLHILKDLSTPLALHLHVLHVHHGLRGDDAESDAQFVLSIAQAWNIAATLRREDVPAIAAAHKLGIEEAARQVRYTHLAQVAHQIGAQRIAVGHNADDQVETVLMHFVRGSGLAGLRGMRPLTMLGSYHLLHPLDPQRPALLLIRPLLATPRAQIETYCATHNLKPRFDHSNLDTTFFRNRLRHDALPLLESLNPGLRNVLQHSAQAIAADYEYINQQVQNAWETCRLKNKLASESVTFDLKIWRALPLALQRATVRKAIWHLRHSLRDVTFVQVDNAVQVAMHGPTGAQATLPGGLSLQVSYHTLTIRDAAHEPHQPDWPLLEPDESLQVTVPDTLDLSNGWRLTLTLYQGNRRGPQWETLIANRWATPLDGDALGGNVTLRARQPGDRFQPHGVGGSQKVANFMVNAKIAAHVRDRVPLLIAADTEEIAWLVGWRVDQRFIVRQSTRNIIVAHFQK